MNRVYKVIWSKAKHCYVVTSEIARSVTKSASSARSAGRKGAAVLAMAALLFTAGGVLGEAANVTEIAVSDTGNVITATKDDKSTDVITINNVAHATEADHAKEADYALKATGDGNGEVIHKIYARKTDAKDNLKVGNDGVISQVTGDDGTTSSAVNTLVLNKDGKNQITLSEDGIKVGKNSTTMDEKGIYAGSDYDYGTAKAALDATEGKIRGADGNFQVNAGGKVTAKGGVDTDGGEILTRGGSITAGKIISTELNTQGGAITGGMATVTGLTTQNGEINGGDIKSSGTIHAKGKITGNGLDAGTGAISGGSLSVTGAMEGNSLKLKGGDLDAGSGTITTTGNIKADGTITTNNLKVTGGLEMNHITLGSKTDDNYTEIDSGNVTSEVNDKVGTVEYTAESIFNKDGSSITARTDVGEHADSTGKSIVGAKEISQYLGDAALPDDSKKNVTRSMVRNGDTFYMEDKAEDKAVDGKNKYSTVRQNAEERTVTVTDGENTASTNLTAADIKNTAENGMISNTAKNLVNTASENMTNTVGKNLTTTVGGDSSLTAENITNEAKNKITNKAIDVETDATSSIVQKVTNDAGSNTSTQWSYQTLEEMSQADGKTASYLRGAAEEKSQLTDGSKKTTIDTVAGQTNTNITDGTNTSNDLQKADQIASSVTKGTNKTVVNQNAESLASSITDGTKVNNSIHWVDGSAQRIEVDDTHFYAETRTAEKAEEALKSGNTVIDIVKDTNTATVSSAVTDGATITGISQNAKDISLSAAGGTITNDANDVLNKGANSVINKVGDNKVAVKTDRVKVAYGSDTYTTWNDKGITSKTGGNMSNSATNITNSATEKLSNSAADIKNSATESITDKVGENVKRTMTTNKISESVKDDAKSNSFSKTAERDINIITDGTKTSTESQLADSVNTSLKEVDGAGNTTKSLNNVKTVSEDTTKMTDAASGEFSKRSQTVSQIQDKVGKTTVTTIDGKTTLTDEYHNHTTEMDYANVTKDLSVYRNTTLGEEGEDTILTVNSKSTFKDTVKMEKTLEVDGESTFNNKVTITKGGLDVTGGTTTDSLKVTGTSEFRGKADFKDNVSMGKGLAVAGETKTGTLHVEKDGYVGGNLNVAGNIETHDAVLSADSRQVVTGRQLYQTNERVDKLDNRIKKVGANAAALAALRPGDFNPDDKFSIAAGFGSYRNANAAALGLFYRPNENVLLSLGTSFGDGENMVNAGVSVKFGRGKSMAERRKEMADEVSSMRDEMRSQDERIAELEEMLKKQSELIEKLSKES